MKKTRLTLGFLFVSISTFACDCIIYGLDYEIRKSSYVLTVKIIKLLDTKEERAEYHFPDTNDARSFKARAEVLTIYKGKIEQREIELSSRFSNCEPYYEINKEYLLFLTQESGKYFVIPCTSWTTLNKRTRRTIRKIEHLTKY